jgi:hypothetical protein
MESWTGDGEYPNTLYAATDSGWSTPEVFEEWFFVFSRSVTTTRGVDVTGAHSQCCSLVFDGLDLHISFKSPKLPRRPTSPCHSCLRTRATGFSRSTSGASPLGTSRSAKTSTRPSSARHVGPDTGSDLQGRRRAVRQGALGEERQVQVCIRRVRALPFDRARIMGEEVAPAIALAARPSDQLVALAKRRGRCG